MRLLLRVLGTRSTLIGSKPCLLSGLGCYGLLASGPFAAGGVVGFVAGGAVLVRVPVLLNEPMALVTPPTAAPAVVPATLPAVLTKSTACPVCPCHASSPAMRSTANTIFPIMFFHLPSLI